MTEGRNGSAHAVGLQTGDIRPFEQKFHEPGLGEDARHQLAVFQVVTRKGWLVFVETAFDLRHPAVRIVDSLAFAEQLLRDRFQAKRGKAPERRTQGLDAVDSEPPGNRREAEAFPSVVVSPLDRRAASSKRQDQSALFRARLKQAKIELDQIPADDDVRIVMAKPAVEG